VPEAAKLLDEAHAGIVSAICSCHPAVLDDYRDLAEKLATAPRTCDAAVIESCAELTADGPVVTVGNSAACPDVYARVAAALPAVRGLRGIAVTIDDNTEEGPAQDADAAASALCAPPRIGDGSAGAPLVRLTFAGYAHGHLCCAGADDIIKAIANLISAAGVPLRHLTFEHLNSDEVQRYSGASDRPDAFAAIAPRLAPLTALETLHIRCADIASKSAAALAAVLPALRSLQSLQLQQLNGTPQALWRTLTALTALTALDVHDSHLGGVTALVGICALRALQHLDVGKSYQIPPRPTGILGGLRAFGPSICACSCLTFLNRAGADLAASGEQPVASALVALTLLRHLDVSSTRLTGPAAAAVSRAHRGHRAFTSLSLAHNPLSAPAAHAADPAPDDAQSAARRGGEVGACVAALDTLRWLDVQHSALSVSVMTAFAPHLARLSALEHLNIASNMVVLDDNATAALGNALIALTTLTYLNASNLALGDGACATCIAPALARLTRLRDVQLGSNCIRDHGAAALAVAVRCLAALTRLDLWSSKICQGGRAAGARAVVEAACGLPDLMMLALQGNGVPSVPGLARSCTRLSYRERPRRYARCRVVQACTERATCCVMACIWPARLQIEQSRLGLFVCFSSIYLRAQECSAL
jgi:Leucine Rich repeat